MAAVTPRSGVAGTCAAARSARQRVVSHALWTLLVVVPLGCATTGHQQLFFGHQLQLGGAGGQNEPAVVVQGTASKWPFKGHTISLNFVNHGSVPVRFGYLIDEYVARTLDGRAIVLRKDFYAYPHLLNPGSEQSVTLFVPKELPIDEVTHIVATINNGRTVVMLSTSRKFFVDRARQAMPPRKSELPIVTEHITIGSRPHTPAAPLRTPVEARLPGGTAAAAPIIPPPSSPLLNPGLTQTVPVVVEFRQEAGTAIKAAELRWNTEFQVTRLSRGNQRTFYLTPGQHDLNFVCRMLPLPPTEGRVPVTVAAGLPVRVALDAKAHMDGAGVRARVWEDTRIVWDHQFTPRQGTK